MARVVVIGGGFGGLASALRLAKLGHAVSLVEERTLGGALVPVTADGFAWDTVSHTLLPAVVRDLFAHFVETPADLPAEWAHAAALTDEGVRTRHIADYIAGMTDRYALIEHARYFKATPELR